MQDDERREGKTCGSLGCRSVRLAVYTDHPYRRGPAGLEAHEAFSLFVASLAALPFLQMTSVFRQHRLLLDAFMPLNYLSAMGEYGRKRLRLPGQLRPPAPVSRRTTRSPGTGTFVP